MAASYVMLEMQLRWWLGTKAGYSLHKAHDKVDEVYRKAQQSLILCNPAAYSACRHLSQPYIINRHLLQIYIVEG
jgi:hypothetical protein